jgi:glutamate carboxypeptidase
MRSGEAFNVVPAAGELFCDLRADSEAAFVPVLEAIPAEHAGVSLTAELLRVWPGMDARDTALTVIERAGAALGRPVRGVARGGASDAAHFAASIPVTVDGLGPRGGRAHNPEEFVLAPSLASRAEVALALTDAALDS